MALLAVGVDGLAADELHDEVRQAVGRGAAIEEAGDIGMFEAGHDLPLEAEVANHEVEVETALHDFDGDFLLECLVCAHGPVDRSHAAASDVLDDLVMAEKHADQRVRRLGGRGRLEGLAILLIGLDQGDHFIEELAVIRRRRG